jgi:hypothetical protein
MKMPTIIAHIKASPPTTPPIIGPRFACLAGVGGGRTGAGVSVGVGVRKVIGVVVEVEIISIVVVVDTAARTGVYARPI